MDHSRVEGSVVVVLFSADRVLRKSREHSSFCAESEGRCWRCGSRAVEIQARSIWIILIVIIEKQVWTRELNMRLFLLSQIFELIALEIIAHNSCCCSSKDGIQEVQISEKERACWCIFKFYSKNTHILSKNLHLSRSWSAVFESLWHKTYIGIRRILNIATFFC